MTGTGLILNLAKKPPLRHWKLLMLARVKPHSGYAIGAYHANAIGAVRYQSFIAHHAARCRYQRLTCRSHCQKMLIFQLPGIHLPTTQAGNIPTAQNAAVRPNANKTHLTHFLRVLGIFCVMQIQRIKMGLAPPPRLIGCR